MTSLQTRKRKSDQMAGDAQATTPAASPAYKRVKITESQKQALIDNLQLEITERARHLRAHYALQCSDLRARVERRINRIPMSLRKANLGELFAKHALEVQVKTVQAAQPKSIPRASPAKPMKSTSTLNHPLPPLPQATISKIPSPPRPNTAQTSPARGKKRKSSEIKIASDKENDTAEPDTNPFMLPVAKNPRRAKATGPVSRQASRTAKPGSVLSPKSHNSRTFPRSPIKEYTAVPSSPAKPSYIARPISPLKPASPLKSAASAATSAISASLHGMVEHAKRGTAATAGKLSRTASKEKPISTASAQATKEMAPPSRAVGQTERTVSASSNHSVGSSVSASSSSTTVVTKAKTGKVATAGKPTAVKKATSAAKISLKKNVATANKKVVLAEPAAGRRVLRKRT